MQQSRPVPTPLWSVPERNTAKQPPVRTACSPYGATTPCSPTTRPRWKGRRKTRGHAVIEQVFADLKAGPIAHLPSTAFNANAAWLATATIAFNLTRALGVAAGGRFARAETATIRAHLIHTPARVATSARRIRLHLPTRWPWASSWQRLWTAVMTT